MSVPVTLTQVINRAASAYHVPADVLTGIWRIETGSRYPNPYVNSSGYGGLFGTHNWNAPEQDQANTSASILARLLSEAHGNLGQALSRYSGGGYTSVPGESGGYTSQPPTAVFSPSASNPMQTAAPTTTPTPAASKANDPTAAILALMASQPVTQPSNGLPDWANVPAPTQSLLPLLLAR